AKRHRAIPGCWRGRRPFSFGLERMRLPPDYPTSALQGESPAGIYPSKSALAASFRRAGLWTIHTLAARRAPLSGFQELGTCPVIFPSESLNSNGVVRCEIV